MDRRKNAWVKLAVAGACVALLAGCGTQQQVTKPISPESQIQAIQANTHMPENAKAMAIAQIKGHAAAATR